jgi:hypothetical protein
MNDARVLMHSLRSAYSQTPTKLKVSVPCLSSFRRAVGRDQKYALQCASYSRVIVHDERVGVCPVLRINGSHWGVM